jgi:hypothetical protein
LTGQPWCDVNSEKWEVRINKTTLPFTFYCLSVEIILLSSCFLYFSLTWSEYNAVWQIAWNGQHGIRIAWAEARAVTAG